MSVTPSPTLTEPPAAPTGLAACDATASSDRFTWARSASATAYNVYRDGFRILSVSEPEATVASLPAGSTYLFTVTATNVAGESAKSPAIKTGALPEAPKKLECTRPTRSSVYLSWIRPRGATGYNVYHVDKVTKVNDLVSAVTGTTTAVVSRLKPRTDYMFTVTATNTAGESSESNSVAKKTRRWRVQNRTLWRVLIVLGVLLALAALVVLLIGAGSVQQFRIRFTAKTAAAAAAAIVLVAAFLLWAIVTDLEGLLGSKRAAPAPDASHEEWVAWRRRGLRGLIVGADGRASTSKTQAALWTLVVLFALVYLALVGHSPNCAASSKVIGMWHSTCNARAPRAADTGALFGSGFPGDLLVLLFAYAGALFVKNDTTNAVTDNPKAQDAKELKPDEKADNLAITTGQLFTNDQGKLDLLDTQYLVFTVFTVGYFLFQLIAVTKNAFPSLGGGLLTLAGTSTLSYTVKKYLENQQLKRE
jgi:hypothetical protein